MGPLIDGVPLGTIAPSALLSLIALMYFVGKIVPERMVNKLLAERDRVIASQDKRIGELTDFNEVLKKNNELLQDQGRETKRVVQALPHDPVGEGT